MADFLMDAELALAAWLADEEKERQRDIVTARKYYDGDHDVHLTDRQEEFLYHQRAGEERFALNYCVSIVKAVYERMLVKGFQSDDKALSQWAWDMWQRNRMDAHQIGVHRGGVRDGEHFVFVDWDQEKGQPVFIAHPRYTDPTLDGTGFGCKAFYPDDDPSYPMTRASKRWTETVTSEETGKRVTRSRLTVYYPERVEKYLLATRAGSEAGWVPFETEGEAWPLPWVDGQGRPLGIPIIHFYNPGRRSELWDAVPVQDLINKTALDIIATADACGFPIKVAKDFIPTTDGASPATDGSNYLKIFPGCWISNVPATGSVETIPPADITKLMDSLDSWILKLAQITDTPVSRFQLTRQVAAEGTLKQQEAPLLAKVRVRASLFGNAWEDCMYMARRLANFYGEGLNEDSELETLWEPAETRDDKAFREAMMLEMQMGVPKEMLWVKLGYSQEDIARMKALAQEEMEQASNIGGELLRAFEGGAGGGGAFQRQPQQQQGQLGTQPPLPRGGQGKLAEQPPLPRGR